MTELDDYVSLSILKNITSLTEAVSDYIVKTKDWLVYFLIHPGGIGSSDLSILKFIIFNYSEDPGRWTVKLTVNSICPNGEINLTIEVYDRGLSSSVYDNGYKITSFDAKISDIYSFRRDLKKNLGKKGEIRDSILKELKSEAKTLRERQKKLNEMIKNIKEGSSEKNSEVVDPNLSV